MHSYSSTVKQRQIKIAEQSLGITYALKTEHIHAFYVKLITVQR